MVRARRPFPEGALGIFEMRSHITTVANLYRESIGRLRLTGARLKLSVHTHATNLRPYARAHVIWLFRRPRFVYLAIAVIGLPVAASFWWPSENIIRYAGLWLQLFGIGTVAWGIRKTHRLFGHPSFWDQVRQSVHQWLHDRPKYRQDTVIELDSGSVAVSGVGLRPFVWSSAGPEATPEQRLDALEENLERVRDDPARFQENTFDEFKKRDDALKQEQRTRSIADQELKELLTATEMGGLNLSAIGVILLFLGVIRSTISAELGALLFQPLHCFVFEISPQC